MLGEKREDELYKSLPPYIRVFTRLIIWQITLLYQMLKRFDMVPRFEIVTYEHYLEQLGFEFKYLLEKQMEEAGEELPPIIEEEEDKEPPLQ